MNPRELAGEKQVIHIKQGAIEAFNGIIKFIKLGSISWDIPQENGKPKKKSIPTTKMVIKPFGNEELENSIYNAKVFNENTNTETRGWKFPVAMKDGTGKDAKLCWLDETRFYGASDELWIDITKDRTSEFKSGDPIVLKGLYVEKSIEDLVKKKKKEEEKEKKEQPAQKKVKTTGVESVPIEGEEEEKPRTFYNFKLADIEHLKVKPLSHKNRASRPLELRIPEITDDASKYLDRMLSTVHDTIKEKKYEFLVGESKKKDRLTYFFTTPCNSNYTPSKPKKDDSSETQADVEYPPIPTISSIVRYGFDFGQDHTYGMMSIKKTFYAKALKDGKTAPSAMMAFRIGYNEVSSHPDETVQFYCHVVDGVVFDQDTVSRLFGVYNLKDLLKVMRMVQPSFIVLGSTVSIDKKETIHKQKKDVPQESELYQLFNDGRRTIEGLKLYYKLDVCDIRSTLEKSLQEEGFFFPAAHVRRIMSLLCDLEIIEKEGTDGLEKNAKLCINNLGNPDFMPDYTVFKSDAYINQINKTPGSSIRCLKEQTEPFRMDGLDQGRGWFGLNGEEKDEKWKTAGVNKIMSTVIVDGKTLKDILKDNHIMSMKLETIDVSRVVYQNLFVIYQLIITNIRTKIMTNTNLLKKYGKFMESFDSDLVKEFKIKDHKYPDTDELEQVRASLSNLIFVPFLIGALFDTPKIPTDTVKIVKEDNQEENTTEEKDSMNNEENTTGEKDGTDNETTEEQ